jgi:hypothetical protein
VRLLGWLRGRSPKVEKLATPAPENPRALEARHQLFIESIFEAAEVETVHLSVLPQVLFVGYMKGDRVMVKLKKQTSLDHILVSEIGADRIASAVGQWVAEALDLHRQARGGK